MIKLHCFFYHASGAAGGNVDLFMLQVTKVLTVNTISRYIFKDILKTQGAIFGVLMLIFMSQTFIKFIGRASKGSIPAELVSQLLMLSVPTMTNFMLPLSLFLAVLFSIGSFCSQSEMVVMRSVGYSHRKLVGIVAVLVFVNVAINICSTGFLAPWCEARQIELINKAKSDPTMLAIDSGRFIKLNNNNVVYVENNGKASDDANIMNQIYILSTGDGKNMPSVTISTKAKSEYDEDGLFWLTLYKGNRYDGPDKKNEYKVSTFDEYRALIPESGSGQDKSKVSTKSIDELLKSGTPTDFAELEWRIVQPVTILILVLLVLPLSMVNPRQGRFAKFLPAIIIYISYYLFAFGFKSSIARGNFPVLPGIFLVPFIYCVLFTIPFNLVETEWFNKMRSKSKQRNKHNV